MAHLWFVHDGTAEQGPLTSKQLLEWSRTGQLAKEHKVRRTDMGAWTPAIKVRGLTFEQETEGDRLGAAYSKLASRITDAIASQSATSLVLQHAVEVLRDNCCDESLILACEQPNGEKLKTAVECAIGHDLLYWCVMAILADGQVQSEELESVSDLISKIASVYSNCFPKYVDFKNCQGKDREKFLAVFKRDRSHYGWPTSDAPVSISTDAFVGAHVAIVGTLCSPESDLLQTYCRLVESTISGIIMVEGVTVREKALLTRAQRFHEKMHDVLQQNRRLPGRPESPLMEALPKSERESEAPHKPGVFRQIAWGMSRDEVLRTESTTPIFENDTALFFAGSVASLNAEIIYVFAAGVCIRAKYVIKEGHTNLNKYLLDYKKLRDLLVQKYGEVAANEGYLDDMFWVNRLYVDDSDDWGFAVSLGHLILDANWETDDTRIALILMGDNYDISLHLEYSSQELQDLEDRILEERHLNEL